jgi:hypothetical protein
MCPIYVGIIRAKFEVYTRLLYFFCEVMLTSVILY